MVDHFYPDPTHLELLRAGAEVWKERRPRPARLRGADLRFMHGEGWDLTRVDLREADLRYVRLPSCHLAGRLDGILLSHARLVKAEIRGCCPKGHFEGASLMLADLTGVDLQWADFRLADLLA